MGELQRLTAYTNTRYENMVYQKKVLAAVSPFPRPPSNKKYKMATFRPCRLRLPTRRTYKHAEEVARPIPASDAIPLVSDERVLWYDK